MATGDPHRLASVYTTDDMTDIVSGIRSGKFFLARHEDLGDIRAEWLAQLDDMCDRAGVVIHYKEIPRKDMTLGFNEWAPPTFEQVTTLITAVEYVRATGQQFGPRFHVNHQ